MQSLRLRSVCVLVTASFYKGHTAEEYLNEKSLGLALQESGVRREELFITSKISFPESAKDIAATLKKQLTDLQTTYVDLYLLHNVTLGDIGSVWKQVSRSLRRQRNGPDSCVTDGIS